MNTTIKNNPRPHARTPVPAQADLSPEQGERLAMARIEHGLTMAHLAGRPISTACAQLIAATIHRGPTTALCRFAAAGRFEYQDRLQAQVELWDSSVTEVPTSWWRALDVYLTQEAEHGAA